MQADLPEDFPDLDNFGEWEPQEYPERQTDAPEGPEAARRDAFYRHVQSWETPEPVEVNEREPWETPEPAEIPFRNPESPGEPPEVEGQEFEHAPLPEIDPRSFPNAPEPPPVSVEHPEFNAAQQFGPLGDDDEQAEDPEPLPARPLHETPGLPDITRPDFPDPFQSPPVEQEDYKVPEDLGVLPPRGFEDNFFPSPPQPTEQLRFYGTFL